MSGRRTTRRALLGQAGRVAAAGVLLPLGDRFALAQTAARGPASMAMHVHASFSEGGASMETQLAQAAQHGVDVLWWTEHDWRMAAYKYRQAVHFDGLREASEGQVWNWVRHATGMLVAAATDGGISDRYCSPLDPRSSLHLRAVGRGNAFATFGFAGDMGAMARSNVRSNLAGHRLDIEVRPETVGPDAYLELLVGTSHRPARAGHPAGNYVLSYRFGGPGKPNTRVTSGTLGIITLPARAHAWNSVRLEPAADLSHMWPNVIGRDANLVSLSLNAASRNQAPAEGYFDYLRFVRLRADAPLRTQAELMQAYRPAFPSVTQHAGLEVSLADPHVNLYGGEIRLPDYRGFDLSPGEDFAFLRAQVDRIHASGGLASYTHPFGVGAGEQLGPKQQASAEKALAARLIADRAYAVDILEVGYRLRAAMPLQRYLNAWDACSRSAIFLTGVGVSDGHDASDWLTQTHNFVTWAWAPDTTEAALVAALRKGRVFFGDPARFRGRLDIAVDGCAMGSASRSSKPARTLAVTAANLPRASAILVLQGVVDYSGRPAPGTSPVATLPAAKFATPSGTATVQLRTTSSSFVRVVVVDGAGLVVASSNPVWLLREQPPRGIPAARAC